MSSKWVVTRITTRGLMKADIDFVPGVINELTASNGAGKTGILESLRNIPDGGFDPDLVRDGLQEGSVAFVLHDTEGIEADVVLTKRISRRGVKTTIEYEDGEPYKSKTFKAFVDELFDVVAMDPGDFVAPSGATPQARDLERIKLLKSILDVPVEPAEFQAASGLKATDLAKLAGNGNAFEQIDNVRQALFDKRTGVGRDKDKARADAVTLTEALPSVAEAGPTVFGLQGLQDEKTELEAVRDGALTRLDTERDASLKEISDSRVRDIIALDASLEEESKKIRDEAAARIKELADNAEKQRERRRQRASEEVDRIHKNFGEAIATVKDTHAPKLEKLAAEIAVAEERERTAKEREDARKADEVRLATLKEVIAKSTADADAGEKEWKKLTAAIERLDDLYRSKMQKLPIQGLEVKGKRVYFEGRLFDGKVNTATQWKVGIAVASCRAGKCGLIVVDRAESLGEAARTAIAEAARENGRQLLLATATREEGVAVKLSVTE